MMHDTGQALIWRSSCGFLRHHENLNECKVCLLVSMAICPAVKSLTLRRNICSDVMYGQRRSLVTGWAVGFLADTLWLVFTADNTEDIERSPCLAVRQPTGQSQLDDSRFLWIQGVFGKYLLELDLTCLDCKTVLNILPILLNSDILTIKFLSREIKTKHFHCSTELPIVCGTARVCSFGVWMHLQ